MFVCHPCLTALYESVSVHTDTAAVAPGSIDWICSGQKLRNKTDIQECESRDIGIIVAAKNGRLQRNT
jgi:polyribonucleotide nucleotidyltransferase